SLPTVVVASSRRALELACTTILTETNPVTKLVETSDSGRFFLERAEYMPAEAGSSSVEFRVLPPDQQRADQRSEPPTRLLVDAPIGKGRLVVTGVFVPSDAISTDLPLTLERAHDLAGATPHTMETMLEVKEPIILKPTLVTDDAVLNAIALACGNANFRGRLGESLRLSIDLFPYSTSTKRIRPRSYCFDIVIRQGGEAFPMGNLAGNPKGRSFEGGLMPTKIDPTQPFEITLRPNLARVAMADVYDAPMMRDDFVWAEFRLKFPSSILLPRVEWKALPTDGPTLVPIAEVREKVAEAEDVEEGAEGGAEGNTEADSVEERLRQFVAMLVPMQLGDRREATSDRGLAMMSTDPHAPALARTLPLCGSLEVLVDGALIAPARVVLGGLLDEGSLFFPIPSDVGDVATITVRYTPDPSLAVPMADGNFRFIALPFELVYEGEKAPALRILPQYAP
ncbi:MAG: hypothetical protein ACKO3W_13900, partial [bacterium]